MSIATARWVEETTLREVLRRHVVDRPDDVALRFLPPGHRAGSRGTALTWGQLDERARAVGAELERRGAVSRRVLVLAPSGTDFMLGVLGCLYAGATAVGAAPGPDVAHAGRYLAVAEDAGAELVLTTPDLRENRLAAHTDDALGRVDWLTVADLPPAADWTPPPVAGDALALLQYTSGSTGTPKGVAVTHAQLLAQLGNFGDLTGLPEGGGAVTWMPVHHALGLGQLLLALHRGGEAVFMTPDDFIAEPYRWLRAISDASGPVLSAGPNFAYDRCLSIVDKIGVDKAGLDLSGWHTALVGGERVQPETLRRFAATFGPVGLRPETLFPGYGLTETMQIIVGRHGLDGAEVRCDAAALRRDRVVPAEPDAPAAALVACGPPGPFSEIRLVDPDSATPTAADRVGEVWVRGDAVCDGYWNRPEATRATFGAYLADGEGPFLRTGDLAFDHGGELVVCGRLKELIIIRGRNLHPQDVERSVQASDPVFAGRPGAAFGVDSPEGERLVVVQAVEPADVGDPRSLLRTVRRAVAADHEVEPSDVVLVTAGQIPVTPSGKVRRATCRDAWQRGELDPVAATGRSPVAGTDAVDPADPADWRDILAGVERPLWTAVVAVEVRRRVARAMEAPVAEVATDEPLVSIGMESVRTIALRYGLENDFGVSLPEGLLARSITATAEAIVSALDGDQTVRWPRIEPDEANRHVPFPLTDIQHAYMVGRSTSFDLGGSSIHLYSEHDNIDHDGRAVDVPRLRAALDAMVRRHEALRCVVSADGYQQILERTPPAEIREYDLRAAEPSDVDGHLDAVRAELSHQVIPLDSWPMFDVRVTHLPGGDTRVHVSLDLLIFDVASVRLFFLEWGDLYRDPHATLPPVDVSFRDFVLATDALRAMPAYERSRQYWLARVADLPPAPVLPMTGAVRHTGAPVRERRRAGLSAPRWAELRRRAADIGVTPSALLLAVYATVLGTWSGTRHFTIDVPLFSRYPVHPHIEHVLGDFTTVNLLEVNLDPDDGPAALARRVQAQLWRDLEHRFFNGVEVIREASAAQGLPPTAFASLVFASIREHGRDQSFEGGEWGSRWLGEPAYAVTQTPQVLLDHQVYEDRGGLGVNWDAVADRFPPGVLDDMFDCYTRLLGDLADGKGWDAGPVDRLPAWQRTLIDDANRTAGPLPGRTLFAGAADVARTDPDRVAVVAADATLTFGDLWRHATRIAETLRALPDVGPDRLVAVAADRSAAQIVAAYAVQLAGAAYLPVDPGLPEARQDRLLDLGGARVVLTRAGGPARPWPDGVTDVAVDLADPGAAPAGFAPAADPDRLAYVLFTSGSTGEPKGVALTHRAAMNTLVDANERMGVRTGDRALGLSQLGFDLSVWDVFGVLMAGATLVLPEPSAGRDPRRWLELMAEHRVSLWNSVPALMQMLVEHADGTTGALATLRHVWLSGDWIPVDLPRRIRAVAPGAAVTASGGPTETAIWCVANPLTGDVDEAAESIPYGRPMRNHTIEVLDDALVRCPVWVTGEMYIGGAGLARGYWNDAARTDAVFVRHPRTGERLYRSGDLGRWLPDGALEIRGRRDRQVKVAGYRIEPGEVEAVLTRQPEVGAAVVDVVTEDGRPPRLCAVVTPAGAGVAEDLGDVETDPVRRLEFKAHRHGLRTDLPDDGVPLPSSPHRDDRHARASVREFSPAPVPLADLARLLEHLCGTGSGDGMPKFRYGSAGSLYPVQVYVHVAADRVDGLPGGTYYHDPDGHRLVPTGPVLPVDAHVPDNRALAARAPFWIVLIGQMRAIDPLYGRRSRDFCLLEAGLIAQLLETEAAGCGLGLCQVGLIRDLPDLRGALRLDDDHMVLHALVGGTPGHPDETGGAAVEPDNLERKLRRRLAESLPHYLVPSTIVIAPDGPPLTARGKVDRPAIARLVHAGARDRTGEYVEPESGPQAAMAAVFGRALGVDRIGATDNFFDLGANSVLIVQIHRALRRELGMDLPLMALFEFPTLARLGEHVTGAADATGADTAQTGFERGRRRAARRRGRGANRG